MSTKVINTNGGQYIADLNALDRIRDNVREQVFVHNHLTGEIQEDYRSKDPLLSAILDFVKEVQKGTII